MLGTTVYSFIGFILFLYWMDVYDTVMNMIGFVAILEQAASLENGCKSVCSFCSRMKRGRLYAAARGHGYNVLALGQHLDDLTESFLMSVFHNGRLRTMKAHYYIR